MIAYPTIPFINTSNMPIPELKIPAPINTTIRAVTNVFMMLESYTKIMCLSTINHTHYRLYNFFATLGLENLLLHKSHTTHSNENTKNSDLDKFQTNDAIEFCLDHNTNNTIWGVRDALKVLLATINGCLIANSGFGGVRYRANGLCVYMCICMYVYMYMYIILNSVFINIYNIYNIICPPGGSISIIQRSIPYLSSCTFVTPYTAQLQHNLYGNCHGSD